jgi:hypothetical protein
MNPSDRLTSSTLSLLCGTDADYNRLNFYKEIVIAR